MEIMSPEDRVILWRSTIDAEGPERRGLLHAVAQSVVESLRDLELYSDDHARLAVESLETLDDAGLFARDSVRLCLESLHERDGGIDLLAGEMAGLLRDAAGVAHLGIERRIRAIEMASEWREHVLDRRSPEPEYVSVGDVAAKYGVTTQAVYKWLRDGRIDGERTPGGSWRIPVAQLERDARPATDARRLDDLRKYLIALHDGEVLPSDEELGASMRGSH